MQMLRNAIILALCAVGVLAFPESSAANAPMLRSTGVASRESAEQMACSESFNNRTEIENAKLHNATGACFDKANETLWDSNSQADAIANIIRGNLTALSDNVEKCLNFTDNLRLINCVQDTFGENLHFLDAANTLSYDVQMQIVDGQNAAKMNQSLCIAKALDNARIANTEATNDYLQCLAMIANQRDHLQPAAFEAISGLNSNFDQVDTANLPEIDNTFN